MFVFSSTCATYGEPIETPIAETHPQHPINSYGETKLAVERALPHFERAVRHALGRAAVFQRRRRRSRRRDRRGSLAGDPPHSARDRGGHRRAAVCRCSATTTRRRTAPACATTFTSSDLADAHVQALEAIAETGESAAYNLGTGRPHSVREVIDTVERVTGRRVPWTLAPRRAGDPAVLYAAPQKAQAELHWTPRFADLDAIVRTAWDWHRTHPARLSRQRRIRERPADPLRRLFRYATPYRGAHAVGGARHAGLRGRLGRPGLAHQADLRQRAAEPAAPRWSSPGRSSACTC